MSNPSDFKTTHWSMILQIGQTDGESLRGLMEKLILDYWPPVYAYLRRRGHHAAVAEDLTQEFFTNLLSNNRLHQIKAEGGTFRAYLLTSVRHFAISRYRHERAKRRHPGTPLLPIGDLESFLLPATSTEEDPETAFERHWAHRVIELGLEQMKEQCRIRDRLTAFAVFESYIRHKLDQGSSPSRDQLSQTFSISAKRIDNFLYRGKIAFRKHLKTVLTETVTDSTQVETELLSLYKTLTD